jgi:hypothetical protein
MFVRDKGKITAAELEPGDLLPSHTGGWTAVEKTENTGKVEPVYNFRVADYHTYFVGRLEWVQCLGAQCVLAPRRGLYRRV